MNYLTNNKKDTEESYVNLSVDSYAPFFEFLERC